MKKLLAIIAILCMLTVTAFAEYDLDSMSLEELEALRSAVSSKIVEIISSTPEESTDEAIGTIEELFPDEAFAKAVRDAIGKLSVTQPITQDDLDEVTRISIASSQDFGEIVSIDGIGYLRNLETLTIVNGAAKKLENLPDGFYQLTNLWYVYLSGTSIQSISPDIGNLINLKTLNLPGSDITTLPDELINCIALKELDISRTKITKLPDVLYSMPNVKVSMEGIDIT